MRSHGRILVGIWHDPDFRALSSGAQRVYLMLLSQKELENCGSQPLMVSKWSRYAPDTSQEDVMGALGELQAARFVAFDEDTDEVLIRTFIRNDGVAKQPNILKSALRAARQIASSRLRKVSADELRKLGRDDANGAADDLDDGTLPEPFRNPSEMVPEPFRNPSRTLSVPDAGDAARDLGKRNPSRTLREPFPEPCGEGVGEVLDLTFSSGEVTSSRACAHVRAGDAREASDPPAVANPYDDDRPAGRRGQAVPPDGWGLVRSVIPESHPAATRSALAIQAGSLMRGGTPRSDVEAALRAWLGKPGSGPGLLPHLVSDVIRARDAPVVARRPSKAERQFAALESAKTNPDPAVLANFQPRPALTEGGASCSETT